jgi:hypothetical protein
LIKLRISIFYGVYQWAEWEAAAVAAAVEWEVVAAHLLEEAAAVE